MMRRECGSNATPTTTVQVVAKLDERKAMHKAALAIAEMKKLEMEGK